MKVLFIAHSTKMSGANKSLFSVIMQLKNKIDITVLVNKKEGELIEKLRENNVDFVHSRYEWMFSTNNRKILRRAYKYVIDFFKYYYCRLFYSRALDEFSDFDLIYTNTCTTDIGYYIAKKNNIPHIWHIREFGKEDFDFLSVVSDRHFRLLLNDAKKIIVISEALKNKFKRIVNEADKIEVVYNGFEVNNFIAKPRKHSLTTVNVIQVGQIGEAKRQDLAIRAISELRKDGHAVELYLAGKVDRGYIDEALKGIGNYNKWLHLLGFVDDIYNVRNGMDIEVVCSKSEAFGRVTIESMLHSLVVIGSDTGGTPELIENQRNGLLFRRDDVDSLKECLMYIINHPNEYDRIAKNGFDFAKKFTIERTSSRIHEIFIEIISGKGV